MEHKTILAQGGIVHYWIVRNENISDCIVFTHGVTADHTMFEKQIPYFSDNYTIILWDVPMHGLSRPYQQFTYRDTAEILHSILQKENIEKTFLVGMSMGGYPSQHFAVMYHKVGTTAPYPLARTVSVEPPPRTGLTSLDVSGSPFVYHQESII